jgi:hypothetical protein
MKINRKHARFLGDIIRYWEEGAVVSPEKAAELRASFEVVAFDWKRLAKYSFWIAIACIIISVASILMDEALLALLKKILAAPDIAKCLALALLSAVFFYLGLKRRSKYPKKIFSNEAIFFLGILSVAGSIAFLGKAVDTGSGHFSLLILLATLVYGALAVLFPSKLIWLFSILSLGGWLGTETGYVSGWGAYFLGMNYPVRFSLFGLLLLAASYLFKGKVRMGKFFKTTYIMGLLYLFISLWILSIFGNYGDMDSWYRAKQIELFYWSILFGAVAIGGILFGLKYDDAPARGFGITFLFINLYTRYFEYFWNATHKAIFFAILAVSFWFLGTKAEAIWNLRRTNREDDKLRRI